MNFLYNNATTGAAEVPATSAPKRNPLKSAPDRTKFEINSENLGGTADCVEDSKSNQEEMEGVADLFKQFEDWLLLNGAKFPGLYLQEYADGIRGVHAKCAVDSKVCILSIPLKCLITDHMGTTRTKIGRKLFSSNCNLSSPNLVAVVLYILSTRRDPDHFFQPYYKILPKDYLNFPIFWEPEKLAWLKGSPLIDDIRERKNNMRADYDEVCRHCPEFAEYSFEEFLEVRTAVGSRNFGIIINGEKRTAMVPYADMLNHFRPRETSWTFENRNKSFIISTTRPLEAGQQVMDSYGKKCNSKFFLHYGFAVENNREEDGKCQNEIFFNFGLSSSIDDSLHDTRLAFLGLDKGTMGYRLTMNVEDKTTSEALTFLRVKVADEFELSHIIARHTVPSLPRPNKPKGAKDPHPSVPYISPANEIRVLEKLSQYCSRQLQRYENTYEQNLELHQSGNIPPFSPRRTALIVILGEQEICNFWIKACKTLCPLLSGESGYFPKDALRLLPKNTYADRDLARYALSLFGNRGL